MGDIFSIQILATCVRYLTLHTRGDAGQADGPRTPFAIAFGKAGPGNRMRLGVLAWLGAALLGGCAVNRPVETDGTHARIERRCAPATPGAGIRMNRPRSRTGSTVSDRRPSALSPRALEIAEFIGVRDLVRRIERLREQQDPGSSGTELLGLRQQLSDRILLALLEIQSAAAEADCEQERADVLADRLQEARDERVRNLTILSLLAAGVGGIVTSGLALGAEAAASGAAVLASGATGVAAAAAETGFVAAALLADSAQKFPHPRNPLADIWWHPRRSEIFPDSVWQFLNRPLREDARRRSLRQYLIDQWYRDGRLGKPGSDEERHGIALFFGPGGDYTIDELRDRAAMLDMLEADINLMAHDLEGLLEEVVALSAR